MIFKFIVDWPAQNVWPIESAGEFRSFGI